MIVLNPQKRKARRPLSRRRRSVRHASHSAPRRKRRFKLANPFSFLDGIGCCAANPSFVAPAPESGGLVGNLMAGFKVDTLQSVAPAAVGVLASGFIEGQVTKRLSPEWSSGWRSALIGIAAAGVTGGMAGMVKKEFAIPATAGAMARVAINLLSPWLEPITGIRGMGYGGNSGARYEMGSDSSLSDAEPSKFLNGPGTGVERSDSANADYAGDADNTISDAKPAQYLGSPTDNEATDLFE